MTTNPPPGQPSPWQPPASGQSDPTAGYPGAASGPPGAGYPSSGAGYPASGQPYQPYPTSGDPYAASGQPYPTTGDPYAAGGQPYGGYPQQPGYPGQPGYQGQPGYPGQPGDPYAANPYAANPYAANPYGVRPRNGLALASMIVSLVSIVVCGLLAGPTGAIMGHVARKQIRERGEDGAGMALTGIIVGWVVFVLNIGFIILWITVIANASSSDYSTY